MAEGFGLPMQVSCRPATRALPQLALQVQSIHRVDLPTSLASWKRRCDVEPRAANVSSKPTRPLVKPRKPKSQLEGHQRKAAAMRVRAFASKVPTADDRNLQTRIRWPFADKLFLPFARNGPSPALLRGHDRGIGNPHTPRRDRPLLGRIGPGKPAAPETDVHAKYTFGSQRFRTPPGKSSIRSLPGRWEACRSESVSKSGGV